MTKTNDTVAPGIKRTNNDDGSWRGYRVFQWVVWPGYPKGRLIAKRFPKTATVAEMQQWQEDQRVDGRRRVAAGTPLPPIVTGFAENAEQYLDAVQAMPQFEGRRADIKLWVDLFGEREHTAITSVEIRRQRDAWLTRGPKWVFVNKQRVLKPLPLSPQTVNLRLRALENLWTVLWPKESNPVRDVPECDHAGDPKPRGQSFALAYEVLEHMPDHTVATKGGAAEVGSLSRIRFELMFLTGLEHKQITRLDEARDVDYRVPAIRLPPRLKGRASGRRNRAAHAPRLVPVMEAAVPVLQKFFAMGANKPFSRSSFYRTVKSAVRAANRDRAARGLPLLDETLRPKDWTRHTFGTEIYRRTKNPKLVQISLGHGESGSQWSIYAEAAIQEHLVAAVKEVNRFARPAAPDQRPRPQGGRSRGGKVGGKVSPPLTTTFDRSPRLVPRKKIQ